MSNLKTADELVKKSNQILQEKKKKFVDDIHKNDTQNKQEKQVAPATQKTKEKKKYGNDIEDPNKEIESLKSIYEQHYYEKKAEEDKLNAVLQDIKRREDRFTKREQEYRIFNEELEKSIKARTGDDIKGLNKEERDVRLKDSKSEIDVLHKQILETIAGIHSKTRKILDEQEKDIGRAYNSQLAQIKKDMDEEAKAVSSNKDREDELNSHLEMMSKVAQKILKENKEIRAKNSDLKKSMNLQERERNMLMKELVDLKKENAKLAEQVDYLKNMIEEVDEPAEIKNSTPPKTLNPSPSKSSIASDKSVIPPEEIKQKKESIFQRYENMIDLLKKQLEKERQRLNKARNLYKTEVNSKVELQELLSQCIKDVKNEISSKPGIDGKKPDSSSVQLTQADREKVIEQLLTQERVLALLNDKIFGIEDKKDDQPKEQSINMNQEEIKENEEIL